MTRALVRCACLPVQGRRPNPFGEARQQRSRKAPRCPRAASSATLHTPSGAFLSAPFGTGESENESQRCAVQDALRSLHPRASRIAASPPANVSGGRRASWSQHSLPPVPEDWCIGEQGRRRSNQPTPMLRSLPCNGPCLSSYPRHLPGFASCHRTRTGKETNAEQSHRRPTPCGALARLCGECKCVRWRGGPLPPVRLRPFVIPQYHTLCARKQQLGPCNISCDVFGLGMATRTRQQPFAPCCAHHVALL